jgi:hypothetical protein
MTAVGNFGSRFPYLPSSSSKISRTGEGGAGLFFVSHTIALRDVYSRGAVVGSWIGRFRRPSEPPLGVKGLSNIMLHFKMKRNHRLRDMDSNADDVSNNMPRSLSRIYQKIKQEQFSQAIRFGKFDRI